MLDLETLADRYIEAWNERDETRRRDLIGKLWAEDAAFRDPIMQGDGLAGVFHPLNGRQFGDGHGGCQRADAALLVGGNVGDDDGAIGPLHLKTASTPPILQIQYAVGPARMARHAVGKRGKIGAPRDGIISRRAADAGHRLVAVGQPGDGGGGRRDL